VACGRVASGEHAAHDAGVSEGGAVSAAYEMLREQATRHATSALRKVGQSAGSFLGAGVFDSGAKIGRETPEDL
jgi:hypothetical protein